MKNYTLVTLTLLAFISTVGLAQNAEDGLSDIFNQNFKDADAQYKFMM